MLSLSLIKKVGVIGAIPCLFLLGVSSSTFAATQKEYVVECAIDRIDTVSSEIVLCDHLYGLSSRLKVIDRYDKRDHPAALRQGRKIKAIAKDYAKNPDIRKKEIQTISLDS